MKLLRRGWRFRWYGLSCAALLSVTGWIVLLLVPGTYQTVATVHIPDAWVAQQYRNDSASAGISASADSALNIPVLGVNAFGRTSNLTGTGAERANRLRSIVLQPMPRWRNLYEVHFGHADRQVSKSVVDAFVKDLYDISEETRLPVANDQVDAGADVFRLLEAPSTGRKQIPYGRPVWLSTILVLSILSALLVMIGMDRRARVIHEPHDVTSKLGISNIISVLHANDQEVRSLQMRNLILFCGGLTALLVAYVVVFLV